MDTLRFLTCGSVDDGKSTLIGRLLYDTKLVFEDQLDALKADSRKFAGESEHLNFALLVDGLQAEREQGITIDVAYRFFRTGKRRFIVADCPGHEQYTRNMATGASTASATVMLIDARKGVLIQTKRHSRIASMLGHPPFGSRVNKMDLVGWSNKIFDDIDQAYRSFAAELDFQTITTIPLSALDGENVAQAGSAAAPWYRGSHSSGVARAPFKTENDQDQAPFAITVQWVNRPNADFRGFCGRIAAGQIKPGDRVPISPSMVMTQIREIVDRDGSRSSAAAGESVTLSLEDDVDVSRGDVIASPTASIQTADQFEVDLLWMTEQPLLPGRSYVGLIHTKSAGITEKLRI